MIQDIMHWEGCEKQDRHGPCPQVADSLSLAYSFPQCSLVWISQHLIVTAHLSRAGLISHRHWPDHLSTTLGERVHS